MSLGEAAKVRALALLSSFLAGCGCYQEGCRTDFVIHLEGEAPVGAYVFTLDIDGARVECATRLPAGRSGPMCDLASVELTVLAPGDEFHAIGILGTPSVVNVQVTRDGELVVEREFRPRYRESAPNGRDCGPICRQARESLSLG